MRAGGMSVRAAMNTGSDNPWVYGRISLASKAQLPPQWPYSRGQDCDQMSAAPDPLDETYGPQCIVETPLGAVDDRGKLTSSKPGEPTDITMELPSSTVNEDGSVDMLTSPVYFVKSNSAGRHIVVVGDSMLADGEIGHSKVGVYQHLSQNDFHEFTRGDGGKSYMLHTYPDYWLTDYESVELSFIPSSLAVSQNGRWITGVLYNGDKTLFTSKRYPLVVYDTVNKELQMLDLLEPMMTGGDTPSQRGSAISNDGKTVVTNMVSRETNLYDVNNCGYSMYKNYKRWAHHSGPTPRTSCEPHLLWYGWGITPPNDDEEDYREPADVLKHHPHIDQKIETPLHMRFVDDMTLEFAGVDISAYANKNQVKPEKVYRYQLHVETMLPPNTDPLPPDPGPDDDTEEDDSEPNEPADVRRPMLLGIGDSYISGEGAYTYRKSGFGTGYEYDTDKGNNKCHTSEVSYPYLLGKKYFETYASVACSGALTYDVATEDINYQGQIKGGISEKERNKIKSPLLNGFIPGYFDQIQFVKKYKPDVMLLSVGGNDIGFADIVTLCVLTSSEPCFQTKPERRELVSHLNRMHYTLVQTYKKLLAASPGSSLYVMGYPEVVKVGGNCGVNVHLDADEVRFADQLVTYINMVVARAAVTAGAQYINVADAFKGHRLCEQTKTPAVNGLTLGNDILGVIGKESYHPTAFGHKLLSRTIEVETESFTKPMPTPKNYGPMTVNDMEGIIYDADDASVKEYLRYTVRTVLGLEDVSIVDKAIELKIQTKIYGVLPNSVYHIVFHSDPIEVASGVTDNEGNIATSFVIPRSVAPGVHVLHIQTTDNMGNDIDIQKTVYVRASETDYDGDGVPDSQQQCLVVRDSGVDADEDGVDDACDNVVITSDDAGQAGNDGAAGTDPIHVPKPTISAGPNKSTGYAGYPAGSNSMPLLTVKKAEWADTITSFAAFSAGAGTGDADKNSLRHTASSSSAVSRSTPTTNRGSQHEAIRSSRSPGYMVVGLLVVLTVGSAMGIKLLNHMVETDKPGPGL